MGEKKREGVRRRNDDPETSKAYLASQLPFPKMLELACSTVSRFFKSKPQIVFAFCSITETQEDNRGINLAFLSQNLNDRENILTLNRAMFFTNMVSNKVSDATATNAASLRVISSSLSFMEVSNYFGGGSILGPGNYGDIIS